ncbi:MAG TPA: rhamnulokinase, partial [Firmicutes bacterium]|nr:rhamnulokinase [Bacillota bacterium]
MNYYLAVDVGATSGRHILGHYENGKLEIEEIYRFETPLVQEGNGHAHWDVDKLFFYVKEGMKKAKDLGKVPCRMGIDTFGVDYALLDKNDERIGNVISYRDIRTKKAKEEYLTPKKEFELTGIQPNE